MRTILVIGAGKSTSQLISYLLEKSVTEKLTITLGDISLSNAEKLINGHPNGHAIKLDVFNAGQRQEAIQKVDIIILK